jgi:MYXO-CTERM domain-containing protein
MLARSTRASWGALAAPLVLLTLSATPALASTTVAPGSLTTQTWTPAGSPYLLSGDVRVAVGVTLTIQAGTLVEFASGDVSNGGNAGGETEIMVSGTLLVSGTPSNPVTFRAGDGSAATTTYNNVWYGIEALGSSAVSITGAVIWNASFAIVGQVASATGGLLTISQTVIENSINGIDVQDALVSDVRISGLEGAAVQWSGTGSITNSIFDHCGGGIVAYNGVTAATLTVENCTIDHSTVNGVQVGGSSNFPVYLVNDLITNSGGYGVAQQGTLSPISATYCDVWNNAGGNLSGFSAGTATVSVDPLYVGATDYHLRAGSPAIDTGTNVGAPGQDFDLHTRPQDGDGVNGAQFDMGAYEYSPGTGAPDGGTSAGGAAGGAAGAGAGGKGGQGGAAGGSAGAAGGSTGTAGGAAGGAAGSRGAGGGVGAAGAAGAAGAGGLPGTAGAAGGGTAGGAAGAAGGMAGSGAAGHGGAAGGAAAAGSTGHDAGVDGPPTSSGSSGCGCQTGGDGSGPLAFWIVSLVVGVVVRRRRPR